MGHSLGWTWCLLHGELHLLVRSACKAPSWIGAHHARATCNPQQSKACFTPRPSSDEPFCCRSLFSQPRGLQRLLCLASSKKSLRPWPLQTVLAQHIEPAAHAHDQQILTSRFNLFLALSAQNATSKVPTSVGGSLMAALHSSFFRFLSWP